MVPRILLLRILLAFALLSITLGVVCAGALLLGAMQDVAGQAVLARVGLGLGVLWLVNLIVLLIALAVHTLDRSEKPPE